MASSREIRAQISSIKKIQKITAAMQNVAASKMRVAQQRMATSMPYATKICDVVKRLANNNNDYQHPYLQQREQIKKVGYILISTDRGLCGGLNLNLFKLALEHAHHFQEQGIEIDWCLFGKKAESFFSTIMTNVTAHVNNLGETPQVSTLLGAIKVMLDSYKATELDRLFIVHNEFVNTLIQKPIIAQLLPLIKIKTNKNYYNNYIFEPKSPALLETLMNRYVETQVYQALVDNIACEQVARMIAMKNATDSSKEIIENLQLVYNKVRQTTITQEISEIVNGANAVQV